MTELDRLLRRIATHERRRALASTALIGTVRQARAAGATWQQIADALGMSRQAAWERFGPAAPRWGGRVRQISS